MIGWVNQLTEHCHIERPLVEGHIGCSWTCVDPGEFRSFRMKYSQRGRVFDSWGSNSERSNFTIHNTYLQSALLVSNTPLLVQFMATSSSWLFISEHERSNSDPSGQFFIWVTVTFGKTHCRFWSSRASNQKIRLHHIAQGRINYTIHTILIV